MMLGISLALCAGLFAALASVCAKIAMATEEAAATCQVLVYQVSSLLQQEQGDGSEAFCGLVLTYFRMTCFGMVFVLNAVMWVFFTKALATCKSSVEATVTNTAANFFFSGVLGRVLFHEALSLLWYVGASCIVVGLLFIHRGSDTGETDPLTATHVSEQDKKHR
ncbi:PREDICTED: transmembrane protein 42-like [Branchiostoma belcheri]|uniref:Transmembrane protein 42-like n=1 Tax=Branchiostoma belcheri TaxID=7741 RepID=A0A6P5AAA8_BRABE|nr:PREDICTED: transmembrane protein 42-like [Branchiostoma belcheri]